jgi:uncharacterized protein (TIGR02145 family)
MKKLYPFYILVLAILFESNTIGQTVTDVDANVYNTIVIGTQEWITENLKTTKLNDGTAIPLVTDNTVWSNLTTPGYCWYNNDQTTNGATYGPLYNWYAVSTNKLCPTAWHVPNDSDWVVLVNYLGGDILAGNKMKEVGYIHWYIPNSGATNESGFTALPAGQRGAFGGFDLLRATATWWTSTAIGISNPGSRYITYSSGFVGFANDGKDGGKSVRCIKGGSSGIDNKPNSSLNIKIYPNPSDRWVRIETCQSQKTQLWIIDIYGKVVLEKQFTGSTEIEITTTGVYVIKIEDGSGIRIEKLVIQ